MSSKKTIDLRKRKVGIARTRPLVFPKRTRRHSPLRVRRRRMRILWTICFLIIAIGISYGASWLSYIPRLSITTVSVVGVENVSPRLVEAYVEAQLFNGRYSLFSKQNIFLYPRAHIEKSIAEYFPRIRTVGISRDALLSQTIIITIEEREPRGRWCSSKCYLLDEDGLIFAPEIEPAKASDSPRYTFTGAISSESPPIKQTFLPEKFPDILALIERLERAGIFVWGVSKDADNDFSVSLVRGYTIRASFGEDFQKLVRNLELVISSDSLRGRESELEYIDLRFGNRVYYKFKNGEEVFQ